MQSASSAVPLLSPVIAPMVQNFGPLLRQLTASPALRLGVCKALQQFAEISDVITCQPVGTWVESILFLGASLGKRS